MHTPICDALGFNAAALGEMVARLPVVSMQLRHNRPVDTLTYIHSEHLEGRYLKDLFEETSNEDLAERYGFYPELALKIHA